MMLRSKLLWAQAPLAFALLLVSFFSVKVGGALGKSSQGILEDNFRSVLAAQRMKDSLEKLHDAAALWAAVGARPNRESVDAAYARFEAELSVQEGNVTESGEALRTREVRRAWVNLRRMAIQPEPSAYGYGFAPALAAVREPVDQVLALNLDALVRKSDAVQREVRYYETALIFTSLLACVLGLLASSTLTARLLRPLGILGQAVRRVGEGDLEARTLPSGNDEIAGLSREFNAMVSKLREYRSSSLGELLETQAETQSAMDSLGDPVLVLNHDGGVKNLNESAERLLGVAAGQVWIPTDAVTAEALGRARSHVLGGRGTYSSGRFEEAIRTSTSEGERSYLIRAAPLYGAEGGISGVTVVLQDVTRLRLFGELTSDLVATVAHELRTPLTSLRMAIHLCLENVAGPLSEKQSELLYGAREDCERLLAVMNDLLDVSRLESGKVTLQRVRLPVQQLLDIAGAQRESAEAHDVALRIEPAPEGLTIEADPERIGLVFTNLVVNALNHTPKGGQVEVRVGVLPEELRFEVADTGQGIPPEFLDRVFDKFVQVPGSNSGGAGLGLYIAKEVIHSHGGEIGVQSLAGGGTTFWFTLPL